MARNNIDQIIKGKLEDLNFDFKDEYWKQMEHLIKTECTTEVAAGSVGVGAFLSTLLIVSFTTIITFIVFFPWAYDFNNQAGSKIAQETNTPLFEQNTTNTNKIAPISTVGTTDETNKVIQKTKNTTGDIKIRKVKTTSKSTKEKRKKRIRKSKPNKKQSVANNKKQLTNDKADIANKTIESITEQSDTNKKQIANQAEGNLDKRANTGQKSGTPNENISLDNDSVYIPDAKLVGDKPSEEMQDVKVDVETKPEPPKTVKPRTKPVKHVFKKRRGLLYRLGIRK